MPLQKAVIKNIRKIRMKESRVIMWRSYMLMTPDMGKRLQHVSWRKIAAENLGTPKTIITMRDRKDCEINQSKYCRSSLEKKKTIVIDNHIKALKEMLEFRMDVGFVFYGTSMCSFFYKVWACCQRKMLYFTTLFYLILVQKPQHFEENSLFHKIVLSGSKHFILCYNWIIEMKPCGMKCMITFPQRPFVLLISPANTVVMWPPELDVMYSWFFFLLSPLLFSPSFLCIVASSTHPQHTPLNLIVLAWFS